MKYYSEITKQFYNSEDECLKEEKRELAKTEQKCADEKIVKDAYSAITKALETYQKVITDYVDKYDDYDIVNGMISDFIKELKNI